MTAAPTSDPLCYAAISAMSADGLAFRTRAILGGELPLSQAGGFSCFHLRFSAHDSMLFNGAPKRNMVALLCDRRRRMREN